MGCRQRRCGIDCTGCDVTTGVVQNLANAFRYHAYDVPLFWSEGLAHWFSRRFDPRFHFFTGTDPTKIRTKDEWNWAPSVRNRVEHEVFPPTSAICGASASATITARPSAS